MDGKPKVMWTVQECADYSGMSPGAIRRKIGEGTIAAVSVGVKRLVHRDVFFVFLKGTTETKPEVEVTYGTIRRIS